VKKIIALTLMLSTPAFADTRPLIGDIGHLIDDGKPTMACATSDGFARLAAGGKTGLDTGCNDTLPDGTIKVTDSDGSGHIRVCWSNGLRAWVAGNRVEAGPDPVPPERSVFRQQHAADLEKFGWSKCELTNR
jgi:hypothetical protein